MEPHAPRLEDCTPMMQTPAARILVALDPGKRPEDPLALGVLLARRTGAPLEAVSVFGRAPLQPEDDEMRRLRADAEAGLRAVLEDLEGVAVAGARVVGAVSTAWALQELTEQEHAGVVVIGSTTRGPVRRTLPGSIADRLLSGAACPVAVAPNGFADGAPTELRSIGVAYDGSDDARVALDGARRLARTAGARLLVVTVHQRLAFGVSAGGIPVQPVDARVEREARAALEEAVAGDPMAESAFVVGRPVDVLVERSRDVDLLLAGSRGYGPLGAVLLGSTTHDLARLAHCPLLITPRGRELRVV